jgi:Uma2 family endonuclease
MSTRNLLTLEEFLNLPEMPGKQELLDGELISSPPAKLRHLKLSKRVFDLFRSVPDRSRVWYETGYRLHWHMLQPDVSVTWPDQPVKNNWF